jgi:hypothetical protein
MKEYRGLSRLHRIAFMLPLGVPGYARFFIDRPRGYEKDSVEGVSQELCARVSLSKLSF